MGTYHQSSGGPWGGGPWGGTPRGNGQPPRGGGGRGGPPPNFDELLRRAQEHLRRLMPGGIGSGRGIALIALAIVAIWLASGFYRVQPDEQGVVLRFGRYVRTTQPGLNYHLPVPIETVLTPKVTRLNSIEIGYRSASPIPGNIRTTAPREVPQEALMLTGDENIVDINFTVFWVIKNATDYLFNIRNQELTVKAAAESAMREVVGRTPIAAALAEGRRQIETDTRQLLQQILDSYGAGITVTQIQLQKVDPPQPVIDAFRDVQRARADEERLRNEAEAYRNDILPRARGDAVRIVQEADAYKQEVVARAQGEAARFLSVYNAYRASPDVTTKRMYIDTIAQILRNTNKIIIDKSVQGAGGVVPYLALPGLPRPGAAPAPRRPENGGAAPSAPAQVQNPAGGQQ